MKNSDTIKHVRGESLFIDDFLVPEGTLYADVYTSSIAHGKILSINTDNAKSVSGVIKILTSKDIPGINQIGGIIQDEPLLAEDKVSFIGQPIAIIIAESKNIANKSLDQISIEYEELEVIVDQREAFKSNLLIMPPKTFESGNVDIMWDKCETIIAGTIDSGGQEHLYLETQGAIALPKEGNDIKILSSTQSPTAVQKTISRVLNIEMNKIEVDVLRLGGAFGGKEDQATHWAVISALGAYYCKKPVKLVLSRSDDLYMTGKRHPYSSDYKIGISNELKILAYEVTYYQNAGAVADLSPAILERTLFHATNSYFIPNVKATAISCKTNLPPNTAFRGFGGPQGKFVIEGAIHKVAEELKINASKIQKANLLNENDMFYYGQIAKNCNANICWNKADNKFNFKKLKEETLEFNIKNKLRKKGFAIMPICFGISFTNTFLNQASALINIYIDGSIGVNTGAIEMGQGVNEKIKLIVANIFSINIDRIKIESTNTTRIANSSATAASSGADLNGNAALNCAKILKDRLLEYVVTEYDVKSKSDLLIENENVLNNGKFIGITWPELIINAYKSRINLSAQSYYSTPNISFDREINKGNPFAYHVYGTSITGVTLDCVRGTYEIDYVKVVHDYGKSLNKKIDLGQTEGAIVQGIGWLTLEELRYSKKGELLSNSLSTYKIPDIYSIPKIIDVDFFEESENKYGPLKSKAIGEPPLMYGIGTYYAIINAINSFRKKNVENISAPITPEKVLLNLYN